MKPEKIFKPQADNSVQFFLIAKKRPKPEFLSDNLVPALKILDHFRLNVFRKPDPKP
jgi:hypothetical protein